MVPQQYVVGVDGGTESLRVGIFDASNGELLVSASSSYATAYPNPSWAEQDPNDWWTALGIAMKEAIRVSGVDISTIRGMALDTTCCSVVALDDKGMPLRPCLLWMDMRSGAQCTHDVLATGDPALAVNSGGRGPISAEWMIPKALWLKRNEPEIYSAAKYICEYQDMMNFRLTGKMVASVNNASIRWHYSAERGFPMSLLKTLDLEDLPEKWPSHVLKLGDVVGGLTRESTEFVGLPEGLPVAQGGADAFIGMVGLGVVTPNQLALLTGSSHLHLGLCASPLNGIGMWGGYSSALVDGLYVVEGGQTSTGSVAAWFRKLTGGTSYKELDEEASKVPIGCEGLVCLDHFQGNRTPYTDPLSRGAFVGLTLRHGRGHMFRAIIEAVCMGTELVLEAMRNAGFTPDFIASAGGATRSAFWLQTHADVSGVPIRVTSGADACLLGAGILASVGAGLYANIQDACTSMVKVDRVIEPNMEAHAAYKPVMDKYRSLYFALKQTREGSNTKDGGVTMDDKLGTGDKIRKQPLPSRTCSCSADRTTSGTCKPLKGIVSASILAADFADLGGEVLKATTVGADRCHIDVVDNHFAKILTFGTPIVKSLRRRFPSLFIDVHLAVERPMEYISQLSSAGATQVLFHIEACTSIEEAKDLARAIRAHGMLAGIVLNPATPVSAIEPLLSLDSLELDCVNFLAVQPGFGGQAFAAPAILDKVTLVRAMCPCIDIQVDGGVRGDTARACVDAGANVLVAGSYIFGGENYAKSVAVLKRALAARW